MKPQGGARQGAGRPKGSVNEATAIGLALRKKLTLHVKSNWDKYIKAADALALGHYKERTLPDGKTVIVYQTSPSSDMLKYLTDQTIGRSTENVNIKSPNGGGVVFVTLPTKQKIDERNVTDMGATTETG